jgi:hypothetical protein
MSFDEARLEPGSEPNLLLSMAQVAPLLAILALLFGFAAGQFLQSQFADVTARLDLSRQAIDQFDDILDSVGDYASRAQASMEQVFHANNEQIELPKPMQKASEGEIVKEGEGADAKPSPPPQPLPQTSTMKGVEQLRDAYGAVSHIQQTLDTQIEVPDDTSMDAGLFSAANAAKKSHVRKVAPSKPSSGSSFRLGLLLGFTAFLGVLTIFCLWMHARVTSPAVRKLYERLSFALVMFFIVATVGMFGAFLGVKIVLPTS